MVRIAFATRAAIRGRAAVPYLRVSTGRQAERGMSMAMQLALAQQRGKRERWKVEAHESDPAKSGRSMRNRPGLERALKRVCEAKGILVVYSLSRLARNVFDLHVIINRLLAAEADLISLSEPIDLHSAMGRAFFNLLATMAQLESDLNSDRVTDIYQHRLSLDSQARSGPIPYGYRLVAGKLVANLSEQKLITKMISWRRRRWVYNEIAEELNRLKVTCRGKRRRWIKSSIWRILKDDRATVRRLKKIPAGK
jgi:site-specific DNA recombinase